MSDLPIERVLQLIDGWNEERSQVVQNIVSMADDLIVAPYRYFPHDTAASTGPCGEYVLLPFAAVQMMGYWYCFIYNHELAPQPFDVKHYYAAREAATLHGAWLASREPLRWFTPLQRQDILLSWRSKNEPRDLASEKYLYLSFYPRQKTI